MRRFKKIINWFIRGKDGHIYLAQIPNVPILGWFIFMVIAHIAATDSIRRGLSNLSLTFLTIWAYLEITKGDSPFRRVLGAAVAIAVIYDFFNRVG